MTELSYEVLNAITEYGNQRATFPYNAIEKRNSLESEIRKAIDGAVVDSLRSSTRNANFLRDECHLAALEAGWWKVLYAGMPPGTSAKIDIRSYPSHVLQWWIGTKLALIHSEVSEALEGLRKDKMDDHLPHLKSIDVELADAVIRIMDLCGGLGIDIGRAITEKLAYNAAREDHKAENREKAGGKAF